MYGGKGVAVLMADGWVRATAGGSGEITARLAVAFFGHSCSSAEESLLS